MLNRPPATATTLSSGETARAVTDSRCAAIRFRLAGSQIHPVDGFGDYSERAKTAIGEPARSGLAGVAMTRP